MGDTRYIVIRNWHRFQHYHDRRPPWIKNYLELLGDPNYIQLTFPQRAILHGLWLMYAESRSTIPLDTRYVSRRLNGRVTNEQLEALNHAGFIDFCASKPLASRAHATETETEEPLTAKTEDRKDGLSQNQKLLTPPSNVARTNGEEDPFKNGQANNPNIDWTP